jgi:hypothetical protein
MLGFKSESWFLGTKTCWFFESHLKRELFKVMWNLRTHPEEWQGLLMHDNTIYDLKNHIRKMSIWTANHPYGTSFTIGGRKYGGVNPVSVWFGILIPWRRNLHKFAMKMARKREVKKWGVWWDSMPHEQKKEWLQ